MAKYKKAQLIETEELCCFDCGQNAKFIAGNGNKMCSQYSTQCPANRGKNAKGVINAHRDGKIPGWNKLNEEGRINRAWSKGLTKEIDIRVARPNQIGIRFGASLNGHNEETKRKLSLHRIEVLETSPHVKWMELPNGIKVQGTWEYNVGLKLLELGISFSRERLKYDNYRTYTPDFYIGNNVYIEVKGWLSNRDVLKYKKVLSEYPDIKIILIRNENKIGNYDKFIEGKTSLHECEDLRQVIFTTF